VGQTLLVLWAVMAVVTPVGASRVHVRSNS